MGCAASAMADPLTAVGEGEEKAAAVSAFTKTVTNAEIISVERIENPRLREAYDAKLKEMVSANGASAEATERRWLFHGTDESTVSKIASKGFDRSCSKDAVFFGKGVYFARDASLSASPMYARPNAAGVQHMLLVRVAVGTYCLGKKDAMEPDARPNGRPYDSTTNDLDNPGVFVTYDNAQAFPEYLIKFKPKGEEKAAAVRDASPYSLTAVGEGEEKAAAVSAFTKTVMNAEIISVERIENPRLLEAYDAKVKGMMSANGTSAEPTERRWLFHGTDESTVSKIASKGFDRSCSKDAVFFGKGVYFARDASLSASPMYARPNAAGVQHMLLVRVAVGTYCLGKKDAMEPDARPNGRPYDSTTNDLDNPGVFVTYDNAQAFPEYLIKFKQLISA